MFRHLLTLTVVVTSASADGTPPTFTVDLDAPTSTRWDALVTQYNASLWAAVSEVEQSSSTYKALLSAANALFKNESKSGWLPQEHWEEIGACVHGLADGRVS